MNKTASLKVGRYEGRRTQICRRVVDVQRGLGGVRVTRLFSEICQDHVVHVVPVDRATAHHIAETKIAKLG